MTTGPELAGYSEAAAHLFTWVADKTLGGAKKALGWGWSQVEWAKAQDRYDARMVELHGSIRIFGQTTPKPLREIYTDVYVLDKPSADRRFDREQLINHLWNEDRGLPFRREERRSGIDLLATGKHFFILGKPGAGKTTFLKFLAVREAQRGQSLGKVPIFVALREYAEAGKSLLEFIVDQFAICHFPGDATPFIEALLKSGQALVLFDGLDEVSKSETEDRRGEVTAELMAFARQYDACHILLTCRIAALDATLDPQFIYLEMADFAPEQVEQFVRAWFWDAAQAEESAALAEQMLDEWRKPDHAGIRDLGRSPLLLALLCLNYAETGHFPPRRVEIYQEALDALLKKWDSSRRIRRGGLPYKQLSLGRRQQMFASIAYTAFAREEREEIVFPKATLERWLLDYLVNVPEMPAAIDIDAEEVLHEIVAQHGIFVEQARHLFSFAHLTFQEYYAASYIANHAGEDATQTLLAHMTGDRWREVFLLTASLLPDATTLLANMEAALQHLAAQSSKFSNLLRSIGEHADESQSGYSRSAIRLHFLALALDLALARALDLDLARALDLDLARDLDLDLARDRAKMVAILDRLQRQNRTSLYEAVAAVKMPDRNASRDAWMQYVDEVHAVVEASGELNRYRRLQAESKAVAEGQEGLLRSMDKSDFDVFSRYIQATRLFYDCLQVAYTPERKAFEARIVAPPP